MAPTPTDSTVVYVERPIRSWMWRTCWVLIALVAVVPVALDPPDTIGRAVVDVIVYGLVWGIVFWIVLLTLFSIDRYGRITLTAEELRVGRHRLQVVDLDAAELRARLAGAPAPEGPAVLMGGAYGGTMGRGSVRLRTLDGVVHLVETGDQDALLRALVAVSRT